MRRLAAVGCVLVLLSAACSDDGESTPSSTSTTTQAPASSTTVATTLAPTTLAPTTTVGPDEGCTADATEMRTLVDETRPTPATQNAEELPSRTIDVWIDRPTIEGPWPLIVFSHGLTGHPLSHVTHRRELAAQCFVVVAPAFPLTNNDVPNAFLNAGDTAGQVGDVSLLIDEMLADDALAPFIDPGRIGALGHSLGGLTTAGAALSPDGDQRISAAVVISAGFGDVRDDVAVMVLHGDADNVIAVDSSITSYAFVDGRGIFVTLLGGDHIAGIIDGESIYGPVVRGLTGAFFAHELDNGSAPIDAVPELRLDLATIEARTADGPLDDWAEYFGV
jgi:dienelactone hydrolase